MAGEDVGGDREAGGTVPLEALTLRSGAGKRLLVKPEGDGVYVELGRAMNPLVPESIWLNRQDMLALGRWLVAAGEGA